MEDPGFAGYAGWWVQGLASAFVAQAPLTPGTDDIAAQNLGWVPAFTGPSAAYTGLVAAGDPVGTFLDGDNGFDPLDGEEFLVQVSTSSNDPDLEDDQGNARDEAGFGSWTVNAEMVLKVPDTVLAGSYVSVLTLTLFE
jgi:hypothetical protein